MTYTTLAKCQNKIKWNETSETEEQEIACKLLKDAKEPKLKTMRRISITINK